MAAPKGNQFWKLRSKHGRDKLFKTPELMWEAATEYFQWCIDNPLIENRVINSAKEGVIDHLTPKMRAYTMTGLCFYLDCSEAYFRTFKSNLKSKDNKIDKDFLSVLTHIEAVVFENQLTGGMAELLSPNLVARALGLVDKREETGSNFDFSKLKIEIVKGQKEDE